jgi:hypothetical protein
MNALLSHRKANGACVRDRAINTDNVTLSLLSRHNGVLITWTVVATLDE